LCPEKSSGLIKHVIGFLPFVVLAMLTIQDRTRQHSCSGWSRREFLRIGGLGAGGLSLANLLAIKAQAAAQGIPVRDRAVVLLFLQGGPSHIECFDPKMSAPREFRSTTGELATKLSGVTFGGSFPKLAERADQLAIVRNYASGRGEHTYLHAAGTDNKYKATLSALYTRAVGATNARTGLPNNVLVLPEAVKPGLALKNNFEGGSALATLTTAGELGSNFAAFNPSVSSGGSGGSLRENMELRLPRERFLDRRTLLTQLDSLRRQSDQQASISGAIDFERQAFDVLARGVGTAFDLSDEDPRTIEKYDTTKLFRLEQVTRYLNMHRSSNLLGHQMLLARRLCEAGCGFVTVSDCGWDMHADSNSMPGMQGMDYLGRQVDHAVAAFLDDVAERGLSDKILLVVTGEMGRTPRINNRGGRDHYGELTPLVLAGGGLPRGTVIGQSDRTASRPVGEPYKPQHLWGTVIDRLFDVGQLRISRAVPGDIGSHLSSLPVITELSS
jgi:hypothetical protein